MMHNTLSVGDVARRSGVAVSTLHYYEEKGLIQSLRTQGNQRRYHRSILRRVAIIRIAKQAGISLRIIKSHLEKFPSREVSPSDWQQMSSEWRAMLNNRILSLTQLRDKLDSCIGCGCLSLRDCPLRNPEDKLGEEGPGARFLEEEKPC